MSQNIFKGQKNLSQNRAGWIAGKLIDRLMFSVRTGGAIKELTVRLKRDGEIFPLEWFRGFLVTLWLTDGTTIVCNVDKVKEIKRKWFFLGLTPIPKNEEKLWTGLKEEAVNRIDLAAKGEGECLRFVLCDEKLRIFLRQEVH